MFWLFNGLDRMPMLIKGWYLRSQDPEPCKRLGLSDLLECMEWQQNYDNRALGWQRRY